ncbi:DUF551 domain-containing protein [Citrobacter portucalensis]|uniref:DUF551 domain-containing protein n=1 Tax=Citrobacter portucalensis TaxID=1639133 RepID=A0ABD5H0I3_9ENTR|nr:DUF551 domain-containing protein [Citrobacter portucalensis]MDW2634807.1 DUF551 domain-containing protein [Citrobacter portucalensis]
MTTNNHPAHGPLSLDRLHQISEILSKASAQSDGGNLGYAMADAVKVIDGVLEARNTEPVAVINGAREPVLYGEHIGIAIGTHLYTTPPAPPVPPAQDWEELCRQHPGMSIGDAIIRAAGWNLCRYTMLQGKSEPANQNDELPLDYLQGHKDGLEWSAQLAEANHPQTGDWLYDDPIELARAIRKGPDMPTAQDGNSPVTPDGWIPVSERMPNDKDFVWCWGYVSGWTESDGFEAYYDATRNKWWTIDDETVRKVTHWMPLPAAPLWE